MDGSPGGVQYTVLIKTCRHLFGKKTYLTHNPPLLAKKPLLCSLVLSLSQLACWGNLFLLPRKYGFWGGRNAKIIVGEIQLKNQRNALESVREIQLRMIFAAVSIVTLCQPSYWGNPPSPNSMESRNCWRGEKLEKIFQEIVILFNYLSKCHLNAFEVEN